MRPSRLAREVRILLWVHHYPPDVNSTGLLMSRVFGRLAQEGHRISVITTFPHYEGFRTWPEYRRKIFKRERNKDVTVTRVYSFTSGKKSMSHRLLNYVTFNFCGFVAALLFLGKHDIVFCTNGSFFSGISGWMLGRLTGAKCVYNLQDLYPEVPISQGELTSPFQIRLLRAIEQFMYRKADHLAVITPAFLEHLETKGVNPTKATVIPNFVDTNFIRPLPKANPFSAREGLTEKFVVTHAGNIGYVYDLDSLLESAALLSDIEDLVVLIVGDGVARRSLIAKVEELRLRNVKFLPFQPVEDLPYLRAASDVQVSLYKADSGKYSMPSKVYEIMASGRPLLASADRDTDIWHLVESTDCGVCVDPGEPKGLAEAIVRLREDVEERRAMGRRGRAEAERNYSIESVAHQYQRLFESLKPTAQKQK